MKLVKKRKMRTSIIERKKKTKNKMMMMMIMIRKGDGRQYRLIT
jgi:hypothetical protein